MTLSFGARPRLSADDHVRQILDSHSVAGERPRRRGEELVPVERHLGDHGATVFVTSDGAVYERRMNGMIRRVRYTT